MLSFVTYFETLLQLSLHSCQFTCTTFHHFLKKKAHWAFFSILKRSYLWKMGVYNPQFSFWNWIAPDMIYLSHIVIIWEKKYFPFVGTVLNCVKFIIPRMHTIFFDPLHKSKDLFLICGATRFKPKVKKEDRDRPLEWAGCIQSNNIYVLLRSSFLTAAKSDASIKSEGKADNRL